MPNRIQVKGLLLVYPHTINNRPDNPKDNADKEKDCGDS
jgi:hypothetical protein